MLFHLSVFIYFFNFIYSCINTWTRCISRALSKILASLSSQPLRLLPYVPFTGSGAALTAGLGFVLARLQSSSHLLQVNTGETTFNQGPEEDKSWWDVVGSVMVAHECLEWETCETLFVCVFSAPVWVWADFSLSIFGEYFASQPLSNKLLVFLVLAFIFPFLL